MPPKPRSVIRKRPQQIRSQETVDVILEATERIIQKLGFDASTTTRICEIAGVSVGTLYQYFPNKGSLLLALSQRRSERFIARFRARLAEVEALPLSEAIRQVVALEFEMVRLSLPFQRELFRFVPKLGSTEHIEHTQRECRRLLNESMSRRPELLQRSELSAFVTLHAVDGVIQGALRESLELLHSDALVNECTRLIEQYLRHPPSSS